MRQKESAVQKMTALKQRFKELKDVTSISFYSKQMTLALM